MQRFLKGIEKTTELMALFAGYGILAVAIVVSLDVILRKYAGFTLKGADEYSGYMLALCLSWGMAYALLQRQHIRIDVLYRMAPLRVRAILDVTALVSMLALSLYFVQQGYGLLAESIELGSVANTVLRTPLWIPQSAWMLGVLVFLVAAAALASHAMLMLARSQYLRITQIAGAMNEAEEALDDVRSIEAAAATSSTSSKAKEIR